MKIVTGESYTISVRFPWGELLTFSCEDLWRDADGTIRWASEINCGLEPFLDCPLEETDGWVMGWLGGVCDTVVVISSGPDAPTP